MCHTGTAIANRGLYIGECTFRLSIHLASAVSAFVKYRCPHNGDQQADKQKLMRRTIFSHTSSFVLGSGKSDSKETEIGQSTSVNINKNLKELLKAKSRVLPHACFYSLATLQSYRKA